MKTITINLTDTQFTRVCSAFACTTEVEIADRLLLYLQGVVTHDEAKATAENVRKERW